MMLAISVASILLGAEPSYPADPFADEYRVPPSSEVGLGEGQLRSMLLAGVFLDGAPLALGRGTAEYLASSYFAVRGSIELQVATAFSTARAQSARVGAGMHLFPYRRVDVGVFMEAGPAWADGVGPAPGPRVVPLFVGGLSLDVGLSTLWFLHLDAQVGWATGWATYLRPAVLAGLGVAL